MQNYLTAVYPLIALPFSLLPLVFPLCRNDHLPTLAELRVGQPVKFTVDALNNKAYQGRVESISPATGVEFSAITPDNATGNFVKIAQRIPVRIEVLGKPEDSALLRPGMSVQVTIDTREAKQ